VTPERARQLFATARVARLATVRADGHPHLVPLVFVVAGDVIYSAVDAKPKRTTALRRLANVAAEPRVAVLADHYDEDWSALWWVRADGRGRVLDAASLADAASSVDAASAAEAGDAVARLVRKYPFYAEHPPGGPVLAIDVDRWSGWAAVP
jgi:PPOX class probable F420-dependent enzyme